MKDVIEHYDRLIEENNDPVFDPPPLQAYMDKWDGEALITRMRLHTSKSVLEIGVGTGRLAKRVAPYCRCLLGIDVSPKTVRKAKKNLSAHPNVTLVCDDFLAYSFATQFDVIYSSLTFLHIKEKALALQKVDVLLADGGIFVLSIDKSQGEWLDMGTRKIKIYPDTPKNVCDLLSKTHLEVTDLLETEHAYIITAEKKRV